MRGESIILGAGLLVALVGCGVGSNGYSPDLNHGKVPDPSFDIQVMDYDPARLVGFWQTDCSVDPLWKDISIDASLKPRIVNSVEFTSGDNPSNGAFTIESSSYAAPDCGPGSLFSHMSVNGSWTSVPRVGLKLQGTRMLVTFAQDWSAQTASARRFCDQSRWTTGETRDVTRTGCMGDGLQSLQPTHVTSDELVLRRLYQVSGDPSWHYSEESLRRR